MLLGGSDVLGIAGPSGHTLGVLGVTLVAYQRRLSLPPVAPPYDESRDPFRFPVHVSESHLRSLLCEDLLNLSVPPSRRKPTHS